MKKLHKALEEKIKIAEKLPKQPNISDKSDVGHTHTISEITDYAPPSVDSNVDGGSASSIYLVSQNIDGGSA